MVWILILTSVTRTNDWETLVDISNVKRNHRLPLLSLQETEQSSIASLDLPCYQEFQDLLNTPAPHKSKSEKQLRQITCSNDGRKKRRADGKENQDEKQSSLTLLVAASTGAIMESPLVSREKNHSIVSLCSILEGCDLLSLVTITAMMRIIGDAAEEHQIKGLLELLVEAWRLHGYDVLGDGRTVSIDNPICYYMDKFKSVTHPDGIELYLQESNVCVKVPMSVYLHCHSLVLSLESTFTAVSTL